MGLRQLPTNRSAPLGAEHLDGVAQALGQPPGRLEEHPGALFAGQRLQPAAPRGLLAGRETLEAEPVGGQPGHGQRRRHRRRPGQARHPDARLDAGHHQPVARVADGRHPGVRHRQDRGTGGQLVDQDGHPRGLVLVEQAHDPAGDPHTQRLRQRPHPAGVLGGHDVGRTESLDEAGRGVPRLAQRRGSQQQSAGIHGMQAYGP